MYKKRKGRKQIRPSKQEFEYLYYILDMSGEQIAEKYNVKVSTIYNWAHQFREEETKQAVQ